MLSLSFLCLMAAAVSLTGGVARFEMTQEPLPGSGFNESSPGSGFNEPFRETPSNYNKDTFADDEGVEKEDEWQDYLIRVDLQVPWDDTISQHRCQDVSYLSIICQQVEITLGANSTSFIGTIPNDESMVEVIFEGSILRSQFQNKSSALHGLTIPDYSQKVQVPVQVNITVLPNTDGLGRSKNTVEPTVGPMSGGTPITIKGYGLDGVQEVNIGDHVCNITSVSRVLIICTTPRLTDETLVGKNQNITLHRTTNETTPSGFLFTYVTDPNITLIEPTETILSGGVQLTVHGTDLNTVKIRRMVLTVTHLDTGRIVSYQTSCTGEDPDYMLCPTPPIALGDVNRGSRRTRSKTTKSINRQHNLLVGISFILDGVETFKNLNGTHLQHCSALTVYANPVLDRLKGITRGVTATFTPIWPVSDKCIEIQGEGLLDGLRPEDYEVYIGEDRCTNMEVSSNLIECDPPPTRPQVAKEDRAGYNRIPVKVVYAGQVFDMGYLSYVQTLWEYPPGRYTILGVSAGFLLLIILIVVCCISSRRRRYYPLGGVAAVDPFATERDQSELLEEIRMEMSRRDVNNIPKYVNDTHDKHNVTPVSQRSVEDRFIRV